MYVVLITTVLQFYQTVRSYSIRAYSAILYIIHYRLVMVVIPTNHYPTRVQSASDSLLLARTTYSAVQEGGAFVEYYSI